MSSGDPAWSSWAASSWGQAPNHWPHPNTWPHKTPPGPPSGPRPEPPKNFALWWDDEQGAGKVPATATQEPAGPEEDTTQEPTQQTFRGPEYTLRTIGWLKFLENPAFEYYEHYYLKLIHKTLTEYWPNIQFGLDIHTMDLWYTIFQFLELDAKARRDLMLLVHSGEIGRAYANKIMWKLLSEWALEDPYRDLSNKVSAEVGWSRMHFDRPPGGHYDLTWWRWRLLENLPGPLKYFSPRAKPKGKFDVHQGPGGVPLPPPHCWGGAFQ